MTNGIKIKVFGDFLGAHISDTTQVHRWQNVCSLSCMGRYGEVLPSRDDIEDSKICDCSVLQNKAYRRDSDLFSDWKGPASPSPYSLR
jgi:hypothetical protein